MLLGIVESNHIMVDIFEDFEVLVEAMRVHTMSAKYAITVDAEHTLLILSEDFVMNTGTE